MIGVRSFFWSVLREGLFSLLSSLSSNIDFAQVSSNFWMIDWIVSKLCSDTLAVLYFLLVLLIRLFTLLLLIKLASSDRATNTSLSLNFSVFSDACGLSSLPCTWRLDVVQTESCCDFFCWSNTCWGLVYPPCPWPWPKAVKLSWLKLVSCGYLLVRLSYLMAAETGLCFFGFWGFE